MAPQGAEQKNGLAEEKVNRFNLRLEGRWGAGHDTSTYVQSSFCACAELVRFQQREDQKDEPAHVREPRCAIRDHAFAARARRKQMRRRSRPLRGQRTKSCRAPSDVPVLIMTRESTSSRAIDGFLPPNTLNNQLAQRLEIWFGGNFLRCRSKAELAFHAYCADFRGD